MMKFMMLSSLMGNGSAAADGGSAGVMAMPDGGNMNMLMPLLLMKGGGFDDLFGGLFEEGADDAEDDADDADPEDDLF